MLQKLQDLGASAIAGQGEGTSSGGLGLQSNAALAGQMHEVVRLVQIIAQGTEHLGEKLCEEVSDRRQGDAALAQRLSSVELYVGEVPGPEVVFPEDFVNTSPSISKPPSDGATGSSQIAPAGEGAVLKQSLVSDSLKDSLEQLVTRVNRMLKPEKRTPRQGRSLNTSTAASRDNSMQQVHGDFGLRSKTLERQASAGPKPLSASAKASHQASPKPEAASFRTPQVHPGVQGVGSGNVGRASFVAGSNPNRGSAGPTSVTAPVHQRQGNPQPKQLQRVPGTMQGYHTMPPNAGFPVYRMHSQVVPMAKAAR